MSHALKQYPLPLPHHEAMEAEDFMATAGNREAVAWIERWPDWPAHCLALYGPPGSGKTHLMQLWLARSGGKPMVAKDIAVWDAESIVAERPCIAIDNAERIAGDAAREEALFHLYNRFKEEQGTLLLTASQAPAQWNLHLPDLRSRLASIPAIAIGAPDDTLLSAMLIKQFRDRQVDIPQELVDYLLPRIERSPAAVRDLVNRLDKLSLSEGRKITIALARKTMENI